MGVCLREYWRLQGLCAAPGRSVTGRHCWKPSRLKLSCRSRYARLLSLEENINTNCTYAGGSLASDTHDLRNLGAYYTYCSKDDVLVLVSDGVHDNFDPQQLGFTPQELKIDVCLSFASSCYFRLFETIDRSTIGKRKCT